MKLLNYIGEFFLFRWIAGLFSRAGDNGGRRSSTRGVSEYKESFFEDDSVPDEPWYNDMYQEHDDYDVTDDEDF